MESAKTKIVLTTKLVRLEEQKTRQYVSGFGDTAVFREISLGWYASFEGSHEALYVGNEKPAWDTGDKVKITFEKVTT